MSCAGARMRPAPPPYFDALIPARAAGQAGRDVHLGLWDNPPTLNTPCPPGEFERAQARLTECALELAALSDGQAVLDVACGFGGALAAIDARHSEMSLVGLNIDPRQLDLCRGAVSRPGNRAAWIEGDACALPFADGSFDRVLCVEAMFHFQSRAQFLSEAARCLRAGGAMVVTDIFMRAPPPGAPFVPAQIEAIVRRDYGPWPELWVEADAAGGEAERAGLLLMKNLDWTAATLPSYRVIAPERQSGDARPAMAGDVFRWLHAHGCLTYRAMAFAKRS